MTSPPAPATASPDHRHFLAILTAHLRDRPDCPLPLPVRDWLLNGLGRYFAHNEDLTRALGLRLVGRASAATQARRARRDAALRAAARQLGGDVSALAVRVRRFEIATWPRWRLLPFPPAEASPLEQTLFEAFQNGPVPRSPKQLGRIVDTK